MISLNVLFKKKCLIVLVSERVFPKLVYDRIKSILTQRLASPNLVVVAQLSAGSWPSAACITNEMSLSEYVLSVDIS